MLSFLKRFQLHPNRSHSSPTTSHSPPFTSRSLFSLQGEALAYKIPLTKPNGRLKDKSDLDYDLILYRRYHQNEQLTQEQIIHKIQESYPSGFQLSNSQPISITSPTPTSTPTPTDSMDY